MIQTTQRRLENVDEKRLKVSLASKKDLIIEEIKLISNITTKISPFIEHFGRKANTHLSNKKSQPNQNNLSHINIKY